MTEKWFSYGGQFSSKLQLQRIAFQRVWCEEMKEEQSMNSTLMSRTAIIGVRNIYDYPDTLLDFFIIIIISYVQWYTLWGE